MAKNQPSSEDKKSKRGIIAAVLGVFLILAIFGADPKNEISPSSTASPEPSPSATVTATATPEATHTPDIPREYENALKKAESYLSWTSFSEKGLREQLEFEKFESDAIDYAMKNIKVDWKEQAAKKAKSYYEGQNMSKDGVYDQLIYEKFTEEQAKYGVSKL